MAKPAPPSEHASATARYPSKVPGLRCEETRHPPGQVQPPHAHLDPSLYVVLQGAVTEASRGAVATVLPSTVLFLPAGEVHACRFLDAGARVFSVYLDSRWVRRLHDGSFSVDRPVHIPGSPLSGLALRLRHEASEPDTASALVMEGLTLELLGGFDRRHTPGRERGTPRWLREVRELLRARFAENLSLEEIAGAAGIHPAHLAAVYRRQYGCTVGDAIRQLRIEYACREIVRTSTPLIEIALDAGFANQSHFTRIFRRLTGVTPAEYRRAFSAP
jgi:AraC family transcriptional regulator